MSNPALNWAFGLNIKPASVKFVLVAMADQVDDRNLSYLAVSTLCDRTSLDRKTVHKALHVLSVAGHIKDTGVRAGKTKSIVVYQLSCSKNGTAKQAQKWNTSETESVPLFPPSCTVFPSKLSQKRYTDPNRPQRDPNKRKVKTHLPDDFSISDRVRNWAREKGHANLEDHLESFKLSCQKHGYKYVDHDAAFMEAIRKNWAGIQPQKPDSTSSTFPPGVDY